MKKILAALLLLALVFGAAFAAEASVTLGFETKAVKIDAEKKNDTGTDQTTISSFARGGNDDFAATGISFSFADENYGANLTIGFADWTRYRGGSALGEGSSTGVRNTGWASSGTPVLDFLEIDRASAWVKFADILRIEAGKWTDRKAGRVNSVINDHVLGVFMLGADETSYAYSGNTEWVFGNSETDRLEGPLMATIFIPNTDFLIDFAVMDSRNTLYDEDGNNVTGANSGLTATGVRFQGSIMEGLKLTFTYRWINQAATDNDGWQWDFDDYLKAGRRYRNNFGLYFNIDMIENLKLLVGYGASLIVAGYDEYKLKGADLTQHPLLASTGYGLNDDGAKGESLYSAIDIRAEYALSETVKLATHNNITFGSFGLKDVELWNPAGGPSLTGAGVGINMKYLKSAFILEDAIAAEIGLTETIAITPKVKNILSIATQDMSVDVANGDVISKTTYDRLSFEVPVSYTSGGLTAFAGLGLELDFGDNKFTLGPTTTTTKFASHTVFYIPMGIQVKF